ncbi:helix-turn-helix domain-containing protein [Amycolatopsis nigrescens]|uniref:helix-turn-helix domain-containing protein n=1 Tax=Amycolatopsis nigrescens TaxID=381445 RepID=UPI000374E761|nr:helix-turn-helix transcriptional regulator [Amycolatopsis nigrescens]
MRELSSSPAREPVGARLRRLRTERELTQRALAEPHYTAAYVSSVESGRRMPSGDAVAHFADRLGLDPNELRTGRSPRQVVWLDLTLAEAAQGVLGGVEGAEDRLRAVLAEADRLGQARQSGLARLWLAGLATGDDRARYVKEAESALAGDTALNRALAVPSRAALLIEAGEPHYAVHLLQACHDELVRDGYPDPGTLLSLRAHLADGQLRLGNLERAGEYAALALGVARLDSTGLTELTGHYLSLCRTQLAAGAVGQAAVAAAQAIDALHERALRPALARCLEARARARRRTGDPRGALTDLLTARDVAPADRAVTVQLAEVNRELGAHHAAADLLAEALREIPADDPLAAAVRYELGALASARGEFPKAEKHLRAAIDLAVQLDARETLANALELAGGLLRTQGRLDDAADLLRDGLLSLGAAPH